MNLLKTKTITVTKDILDFPFHLLAETIDKARVIAKEQGDPTILHTKPAFEKFSGEWGLLFKYDWMIQQSQAYIVEHFNPTLDNLGSYDGAALATALLEKSEWHAGMYRFLTPPTRGLVVPDQCKPPNNSMSGLVPLILAAYRIYRNIPYSKWSNIRAVVDINLANAMECADIYPDLSNEERLQFREDGLRVKTGAKAGTIKSINTYGISKVGDPKFDQLPPYAKMMLAQTWCAAPANRHKNMILDPRDWDIMPTPITSPDIFKPLESKKVSDDCPWD